MSHLPLIKKETILGIKVFTSQTYFVIALNFTTQHLQRKFNLTIRQGFGLAFSAIEAVSTAQE